MVQTIVAGTSRPQAADRVLVVSGDSHAGPSLRGQLRAYCPAEHLGDFDDYATSIEAVANKGDATNTLGHNRGRLTMTRECAGLQDPHARLLDMDHEGVAADVIFAGGQNDEPLPFVGGGVFGAGAADVSPSLRALGHHIWNAWIADFVSVDAERLLGVFQVPIWDVDATIAEMRWAREHALRLMSFPAPRSDFPPYNSPAYEPLWSAAEDLEIPLLVHGGGGERPLGSDEPGGTPVLLAEIAWMSRRALWQMIFGGVFERHPRLKLVFTEQRVAWVGETLAELDSINLDTFHTARLGDRQPRLPSEYWAQSCYVCASFLAPYEAQRRDECGVRNLIWGSDYPHVESTWPDTLVSLRNTFAGIPDDEVRAMIGENAVRVYNLDRDHLRAVADRIGPTAAQLAEPVRVEELPTERGLAFRTTGSFH